MDLTSYDLLISIMYNHRSIIVVFAEFTFFTLFI